MTFNSKVPSSTLKILQIVFFTAAILFFGKTLFIPLFFGLLVAMIMYPVCKWLEKHHWPRSLAITGCLLVVTILVGFLLALLFWQLDVFLDEAPVIKDKLAAQLSKLQQWASFNFGLSTDAQIDWVEKISGNIGEMLKGTISTAINTLFMLFLVPVFTALFLYHRKTFVNYLQSIVGIKYKQQFNSILRETIHTYFNYIKGMILVYIIVGALNTVGLMALGLENALLFGMLCAIMTIIPYVGIFVSALLPISVAWITTDSIWYPLGVIAVFSIVQYLEANVIFPKVVGKQLNLSTWATLVAIIAGGILWGVSGMVLFIPFLAFLKIITDNVEEWKPLNLLLSR